MSDEQDPIVLPIGDSIDLHTFAPRDIPDVVESYLEAAHEEGFEEVRIIHGRGKGVQKERVRQVLEKSELEDKQEESSKPGPWRRRSPNLDTADPVSAAPRAGSRSLT